MSIEHDLYWSEEKEIQLKRTRSSKLGFVIFANTVILNPDLVFGEAEIHLT